RVRLEIEALQLFTGEPDAPVKFFDAFLSDLVCRAAFDEAGAGLGLSKSVAAGVRGGWVACPPHFDQRIKVTHRMITGGLPFILAETCARL
ncbi:hypothetical protein ACC710_36875, partial [Rhizobium ruizarguesonis]